MPPRRLRLLALLWLLALDRLLLCLLLGRFQRLGDRLLLRLRKNFFCFFCLVLLEVRFLLVHLKVEDVGGLDHDFWLPMPIVPALS